MAGWTAGSLDGNSNAGSVDLFAMKVDGEGSWEWTLQTGTAREEWAGGLQIIPSGRILLAGSIKGGLDGSDSSAMTRKHGMNWSYFLSMSFFHIFPFPLCTCHDKRGFHVGKPHLTCHQGEDILAVELDTTGSLQWKFVAGTNARDVANAVQLDASNNVILAGTTGRDWTNDRHDHDHLKL